MSKKNIKFTRIDFELFLPRVLLSSGVSIIHYLNQNQENLTFVGYSPNQILKQSDLKKDFTEVIETSLRENPDVVWSMATSYEWGCAQLGLETPHANAIFIEYQNYMVINHNTESAYVVGHSFALESSIFQNPLSIRLTPFWGPKEFESAILKAQDLIKEGHVYQINLSYPAKIDSAASIEEVYLHCYALNAAQHGAFMKTENWGIASASPEEFFYYNDGYIRTKPIKGTIGRQTDPQKDRQAYQALLDSEKDRAELVMITDLMRNDLSQCADIGSVITRDLCKIETFEYVYHLVSTIEGQISADHSPLSILKTLAPGGSITGCPKYSACEIIRSIENRSREFYTGHIGFVSGSGEAAFNVAIRTCYQYEDMPITTHAGCGITIDSNPEQEYQETLDKFRFLTSKEMVFQ